MISDSSSSLNEIAHVQWQAKQKLKNDSLFLVYDIMTMWKSDETESSENSSYTDIGSFPESFSFFLI